MKSTFKLSAIKILMISLSFIITLGIKTSSAQTIPRDGVQLILNAHHAWRTEYLL